MKPADWLQFLGQILAAVILGGATMMAARIGKPRDPMSDERVESWFLRVCESPWVLPPLLALFYIVRLVSELEGNGALTRIVVLNICSDVVGIFWAFVLILLSLIGRRIEHIYSRLLKLLRSLIETQQQVVESHSKLADVQLNWMERSTEALQSTREVVKGTLDNIEGITDIVKTLVEDTERVRPKNLLKGIRELLD